MIPSPNQRKTLLSPEQEGSGSATRAPLAPPSSSPAEHTGSPSSQTSMTPPPQTSVTASSPPLSSITPSPASAPTPALEHEPQPLAQNLSPSENETKPEQVVEIVPPKETQTKEIFIQNVGDETEPTKSVPQIQPDPVKIEPKETSPVIPSIPTTTEPVTSPRPNLTDPNLVSPRPQNPNPPTAATAPSPVINPNPQPQSQPQQTQPQPLQPQSQPSTAQSPPVPSVASPEGGLTRAPSKRPGVQDFISGAKQSLTKSRATNAPYVPSTPSPSEEPKGGLTKSRTDNPTQQPPVTTTGQPEEPKVPRAPRPQPPTALEESQAAVIDIMQNEILTYKSQAQTTQETINQLSEQKETLTAQNESQAEEIAQLKAKLQEKQDFGMLERSAKDEVTVSELINLRKVLISKLGEMQCVGIGNAQTMHNLRSFRSEIWTLKQQVEALSLENAELKEKNSDLESKLNQQFSKR